MTLLKKYVFVLLLLFNFCANSQETESISKQVDSVLINKTPITLQVKKTFSVDSIGIYLSNEFDGARLNDVSYINDSTISVQISPENFPINNSPYYSFKLWAKDTARLYIKFNYQSIYKHRYIPKIKYKGTWSIASAEDMSYGAVDSGFILFQVVTQDTLLISSQQVVNSTDVGSWISKIENKYSSLIHKNTIGKSVQGRTLNVLDIYRDTKKKKNLVVLLTRQHPPEITGYFAFQNFLLQILGDTINNKDFFKKNRILAFPLINPDGVDNGHWRHNVNGVDLNRDWNHFVQPETRSVTNYIINAAKKHKVRVLIGLDFHSTFNDVFYTNKQKPQNLPEFLKTWFAFLEENIKNYKVNEVSSISKKAVSKAWFLNEFEAVGVTYEIGDETPEAEIKRISKASAIGLMKILNEKN